MLANDREGMRKMIAAIEDAELRGEYFFGSAEIKTEKFLYGNGEYSECYQQRYVIEFHFRDAYPHFSETGDPQKFNRRVH